MGIICMGMWDAIDLRSWIHRTCKNLGAVAVRFRICVSENGRFGSLNAEYNKPQMSGATRHEPARGLFAVASLAPKANTVLDPHFRAVSNR